MNPSAETLMVHHRIEAETFQQGRKFARVWFGSDNVTRPSSAARTVVLTRQTSYGPLRHCQDHVVYLKVRAQEHLQARSYHRSLD